MARPDSGLYFVRFLCRTDGKSVLDDFLLCGSPDKNAALPPHRLQTRPWPSPATIIIADEEIPYYDDLHSNTTVEFLGLFPRHSRKRIALDGYCFSLVKYVLDLSAVYRDLVLRYFTGRFGRGAELLNVEIRVRSPSYHIVDYTWNRMLCEACQERRELEVAMSWLSTLGGAFSSLGDNFRYCAVTAGKISAHQFNLALRLGDPMTVIRCKLYLAISLIQTRKFNLASRLVRSQYDYVRTLKVFDKRIVSMCLGIWSKLKYEKALSKSRGIS